MRIPQRLLMALTAVATGLMPVQSWAAEAEIMPLERMWLVIIVIVLLQTLVIIGLQHNRLVNKRSQQALKEAQKALEERIHERTEVLNQTNNQLYDEIAQHEATEILLRETQDYLHSIINAMPSVLIGVTHQGYITHWNTAAEQETGFSADDALGRHISEAYPNLPVAPDTISSVIEAGVPYINESVQQTHKGEVRYIDLSIFPLIAVQAIGAVIRMDDVTLRVRMEHMMIQNEKMMSLGELAAGMAHEINNPLSAILHGVQNIHRRTAPDFPANQKVASELHIDLAHVHNYLRARDIYKILDDMRDAGERSAGIVTNMLEFARSSNRAHNLIDLHAVIDHSLELSRKMLELHTPEGTVHPRIVTELKQDSLPVLGSAAELQQVLLNLLRNATQALETSQFTPPSVPTIYLRLYRDGQEAVIEIEDNGPGMPENVRRHIFEPFFTTKEVGKGTGLGLSVSYFIITEHHAGTIEVESVPGRGSRFIIKLPLTETIPQ